MAKFNSAVDNTTTNLAGGTAYKQSDKIALASLLLTSFASDGAYEKQDASFRRLINLIENTDKEFAAKAAVFARNEYGMRSISHVAASELAKHIAGEKWAKDFYSSVIFRPDDITEILSYHMAKNGKVTNAMKKGLADAFGKFNAYQLAKYRGVDKKVSLVDAVNMVHPVPTNKNRNALKDLVAGTLRSKDTWESKLTKAGQEATSEADKAEKKANSWRELIGEGKLGYLAMLRNLRNIIEQAPDMIPAVCAKLTNPEAVAGSKIFPFQFLVAIKEVQMIGGSRDVILALNKAVDLSLSNVPKLSGKTLIAVDTSGSMGCRPSGASYTVAEIAAIFGASIYKSNDSDVILFAGNANYASLNPADSTLSIAEKISGTGGSTNLSSVFTTAREKYDRIVILSDMQTWVESSFGYRGTSVKGAFSQYKAATGADPFVYSFDLYGSGTMQFPERSVYCLAGFSNKVFDTMKVLEEDRSALIKRIESVKFS